MMGLLTERCGEMALNDHHRSILDFESQNPVHDGHKEEKIYQTFNFSPTRYYQKLNMLLDDPEAAEYKPALINRHRRLRDDRRYNRSANRLGFGDLFR